GLARRTINQRIARIIRAFKFGVENEMIPADVHHALKAVPGLKRGRSAAKKSKSVKPVPDEHIEATLPYWPRQAGGSGGENPDPCRHIEATLPYWPRQVRAMIQLQRLTGMRNGEVVIMRGCDLDTSGSVWIYWPKSHKTAYREKCPRAGWF